MTRSLHPLEKKQGYRFKTPAILQQALTHRSAGPLHNERLEFLGDAVLELVISQRLYDQFPDAPEGDLSRLRARLVRKETLAAVARELSLGEVLKLGQGERSSGGSCRDSILADAVEALVGAFFIDGGLSAAEQQVDALLGERLARMGDAPPDTRDAKTRLQEYVQAQGHELPVYAVESMTGKAHARQFCVSCTVAGLKKAGMGDGKSRRIAEQAAAEAVLKQLDGSAL